MPSSIQLRSLNTPLAATVLAGLMGLVLGVAVVSKPIAVIGLIALLLGFIAVVVSLTRPELAFAGLVLAMALIPVYAAPGIGPLLLLPSAAASWLIAVALAWRNVLSEGRIFRPTGIDYAVGAFVLLMAISISFSLQVETTSYVHLMFLWAGPYLAARLLLREVERPARLLAISFGIATLALAPIAILEMSGASNPFYSLNFNSAEFSLWASQIQRFGEVRAVTSFGHPIAFGMFVAVAALLALAMGVISKERNERYAWYALAALGVGVQALALARSGWLILGIGVPLIAIAMTRGKTRRRLLAPIAIAALLLLLVSFVAPKAVETLPGFENKTEKNFHASTDYRQALLNRALEPGVLHLWGNPRNEVTPFVGEVNSTDNEYIVLADTWGLIPTAALVLVALALLFAVGRGIGNDAGGLTALPIAGFVSLVALFFVAFITQQQVMIWMLVGAGGVAAERFNLSRRGPPAQRSAGLDRM
jgi:hypothetical protein